AVGLTSFLLRGLLGHGEAPTIRVSPLAAMPVPGLASLPVLGPVLFSQPVLTYVALVAAVAIYVFLVRTRPGLTLRAVGENPPAAGGRSARCWRACSSAPPTRSSSACRGCGCP